MTHIINGELYSGRALRSPGSERTCCHYPDEWSNCHEEAQTDGRNPDDEPIPVRSQEQAIAHYYHHNSDDKSKMVNRSLKLTCDNRE